MKKYVVFSVVVMFLLGCDGNYKYGTHSDEQLAQIERNPTAYSGTLYAFRGEVLQAKETNEGTFFQILVGNSYSSLAVVFPYRGTKIARGHLVKVLGYPRDTVSGTNAFGGVVGSVTFMAIAVCDLNYSRFEDPGECWHLDSRDDIYARWASGELFKPKGQ